MFQPIPLSADRWSNASVRCFSENKRKFIARTGEFDGRKMRFGISRSLAMRSGPVGGGA